MRLDWLQEIDHTGDCGYIITAASPKQLFERAAQALFYTLTDPSLVEENEQLFFEIRADDKHALLREWLSRLNYIHITEHLLFRKFQITALSETHCSALAFGEKIDFDRHEIYTEIKAITYHGLKIEKKNNQWQAQVIFDL